MNGVVEPCWPPFPKDHHLKEIDTVILNEIDPNFVTVVNNNDDKKDLSIMAADNLNKDRGSDDMVQEQIPEAEGNWGSSEIRHRINSEDLALCVNELREILGAWSNEYCQQFVNDLDIYVVTWNMNGKVCASLLKMLWHHLQLQWCSRVCNYPCILSYNSCSTSEDLV
jgi:hypothetical protein